MFGAVKVSKILKVSEVQWQRLTWLEIVVGSKASLPQSRQPQNLQRWQWVIADRPQRSRHVCHPVGWSRSSSTYLPICLEIVWSYPLNSPFWSHTWLHDLNSWPNHRCFSFLFFLFLCCLKASSVRCRHRQDWQLSFDATSLEASCINAFVLYLSCRSSSKSFHKDYSWFDIVFVWWFLSLWLMAVVAIWCARGWSLLQSLLAAIWDVRTSDGCSPGSSR